MKRERVRSSILDKSLMKTFLKKKWSDKPKATGTRLEYSRHIREEWNAVNESGWEKKEIESPLSERGYGKG